MGCRISVLLVLDSYVGIMALYWWINQGFLLCPGIIATMDMRLDFCMIFLNG